MSSSRISGPLHYQRNGFSTRCGRSLAGKTSAPVRITGDPKRVTCLLCLRALAKRPPPG